MFVLARISGVEMVRGVELHARLAGQHFQHAARGRIHHFGGAHDLEIGGTVVNDPIVIVAGTEFELFVGIVDASADRMRLQEIKRSILDFANFSGRNQACVHGSEVAGEKG